MDRNTHHHKQGTALVPFRLHQQLNTMRSHLFSIVALLALSANAQNTPTSIDEPCLLATNKETWASLGLSAEQIAKVEGLQTTCKTACAAVSETGERDVKTAAAVMEKHEDEVRKVLTEEQYNKWQTWCSERDGRGQLTR